MLLRWSQTGKPDGVFYFMTCTFIDEQNNELHLDFYAEFEVDTDESSVGINLKLMNSKDFIELHFTNLDILKISTLLSDYVSKKEWTKKILIHG